MEAELRLEQLENELTVFKQGLLVTLKDISQMLDVTDAPDWCRVETPSDRVAPTDSPSAGVPAPPSPCREEAGQNEDVEALPQAEPVVTPPPGAIGSVPLVTLTRLAGWVINTSAEIGADRTLTFLDIAEMMGYLAPDIKSTLEKLVPPHGLRELVSAYSVQKHMRALKELANLLGRRRTYDFMMLQIIAQGMPCFSWDENGVQTTDN